MKTLAERKLIKELGSSFGEIIERDDIKNPYLAVSKDGLCQSFGKTREHALKNLLIAIQLRKNV